MIAFHGQLVDYIAVEIYIYDIRYKLTYWSIL